MPLTTKALERCGVPPATARANLPFIQAAMREFNVTTPPRARMFLAQVLHESMRLTRFEEIDSGARYEGSTTLGNTEPGDGVRFKGRGPIQITGRWNYTHFGGMLKIDIVRHPEWAAQPRHGWRLAAAYFETRGCNKAADRGDFREVTRLINPGVLHLEERLRYYRLLANVDVVPGKGSRRRKASRRRGPGHEVDDRDERTTKRARAGAAVRHKRRNVLEDNRDGGATQERRAAPRSRLLSLVAEARRLDAETNRAWARIVARGTRDGRLLAQADDGGQVSAILLRIEEKLERLVDLEQHEIGLEAASSPPSAHVGPVPESSTGNGAGREPRHAAGRGVNLDDLTDAELEQRIERLEQTIARCRAALIRRYARAESLLSKEVKR